jgi:hypothetical protein
MVYAAAFTFGPRLRVYDGNFVRRGGYLALLPARERQSDLRLALASFIRDPHGAMEKANSTALL